jgi:hypothetical protein
MFKIDEEGDTFTDIAKTADNALYNAVARRVPSKEPRPVQLSYPGFAKYIPLEPYITSRKQLGLVKYIPYK